MNTEFFDVIVVGAGAAGLMCASRAGQLGKRVCLIDHGLDIGAKILISGGGRCNFTNRDIKPENYISENRHFCVSAIKSYTQHDFIKLVEAYDIAYHEKTLGQLFCDGPSSQIIGMLQAECLKGQVDIRLNTTLSEITKTDCFHLISNDTIYQASALVLATGGLSIPKLGATDFSYRIAKQFGLDITVVKPGLVPLTFEHPELSFMRDLAGVSLRIMTRVSKAAFKEGMIFTHKGLSGPAILQISSYLEEQIPFTIDLSPDLNLEDFLKERKRSRPKAELKTILGEIFPQRLAVSLTSTFFSNDILGSYSDHRLAEIARHLHAWTLIPHGSEGYIKAEVTCGGISTHGLSSKTMEAKAVPGLYVIGEAVDVTGWLGGYNFQWAWSSGWAAGSATGIRAA